MTVLFAELRRLETLRPEFDKREIQVLTVSTDSVEELQNGRDAHGLQAIMLPDADLKVTDAFGYRNTLYHSAPPGDERLFPVPATLLVDRNGKVLWMDVAENYQRRSGPEVVLAALQKHLDSRIPRAGEPALQASACGKTWTVNTVT